MIYFCFVQGDETSVGQVAAQHLRAQAASAGPRRLWVGPRGQEIALGVGQEEPEATLPLS